jgi:hypothetical protein
MIAFTSFIFQNLSQSAAAVNMSIIVTTSGCLVAQEQVIELNQSVVESSKLSVNKYIKNDSLETLSQNALPKNLMGDSCKGSFLQRNGLLFCTQWSGDHQTIRFIGRI